MFAKLSVKKPYTVLVAVLLVLVLGAVSLMKMTTDLLPDMSFQYALIITTDVGASPEAVEKDVTAPIEAAMATTSNIKNISSTSYNSYSIVTCEYEQNANMDSVVIEIQQKLDQLEGRFPDTVGTPMIMQINPDMLPIMTTAVNVDGLNRSQIADYVNNELIPALESVEGVASVSASGALEEHAEVVISQAKIDALNEKLLSSINSKFDEAQAEIDDGKQKIEDAKDALEEGKSELASSIGTASNEINNNRVTLINTKAELESQLTNLENSYKSIDGAISALATTYKAAEQVQTGIDGLTAASNGLKQAKQMAYDAGYNAVYDTAFASSYETAKTMAYQQAYQAVVDGYTTALKETTKAVAAQAYAASFGAVPIYSDLTGNANQSEAEAIIDNMTLTELTAAIDSLSDSAYGGAYVGVKTAIYSTVDNTLQMNGADINTFADSVATSQVAAHDAEIRTQAAMSAGMTASAAGNQAAAMAETQAIAAIKEQSGIEISSAEDIDHQIITLNATLNDINMTLMSQSGQYAAMGVTITSYKDIIPAIVKIDESKEQLADGIEQLKDGIAQIDEGLTALDDGQKQLTDGEMEGLFQIANGYTDLVNAATQIESGQAALDSAKDSALEQADLNNVVTVSMVSQLLVAQNFDMPAGYAYDEDGNEYLIKVGESVESIEALTDLVLMDFGTDEVGIVKLSDVADINLLDNSDKTYAIVNGNPGIMLTMEKQSGYSTGDVTDALLARFKLLEKENENLHIAVMMDQGVYVDMVVKSVFQNMILGAILAIFVLLLFLKDIKPTIIIACSIPLSVVAAVVLMYFTGISMNLISMSGLVLGIGMLVDNSIVVIENIYRLRDQGYPIKKAAIEGAGQVTGAIFASTLTTVSVYAPIIFTDGITRQLFVDLALTIAYTLMASLVVAVTLVPAMSAAMLKSVKTVEVKHSKLKEIYGKFLAGCLRFKPVVFLVAIALLVISIVASLSRGLNFMDMEMETNQMSISIGSKDDQNLEFGDLVELSDTVIARISDIEGIETIGAMMGGSSTMSLMNSSSSVSMYLLLDENEKHDLNAIAEEIERRTSDLDCKIEVETNMMDMSAMMASGLSIEIKGSKIETLQELAKEVAEVVRNTEGTIKVKDGLDNTGLQYMISVDREKAAKYGYTVAQVFQLVYSDMASSTSATTISNDIKDLDIFVKNETQSQAKLADIENRTFTWKDEDGEEKEIPLTEIATMTKTTTLSTIKRDSQTRYLTVSAGIDNDHNITLVSSEIQKGLEKINVPEGYTVSMKGEDQTINESMSQLVLMLILAVVFIYLIMVAQFQSLLSPFIIMFSIPLGFTGGFFALYFCKEELSVISMLGFIMLAGLIVNNGIVLIDYINQARRQGMSKKDAIIDAGQTRMRPILMTALTTILAMLTQALGIGGDGADMMAPMAISIIGGLVYGTLLTLIVIPCIYDLFNKEKDMREEDYDTGMPKDLIAGNATEN